MTVAAELSRRLGRACHFGSATVAERARIIAARRAGSVRTFKDLPQDVQQLVLDLEARAAAEDQSRDVNGGGR